MMHSPPRALNLGGSLNEHSMPEATDVIGNLILSLSSAMTVVGPSAKHLDLSFVHLETELVACNLRLSKAGGTQLSAYRRIEHSWQQVNYSTRGEARLKTTRQ